TPRTPGDYNIPSMPFTYFNPQSGKYVTVNTQPIKLRVTAGKNYSPDAPRNVALTDIHAISTAPLKSLTFKSRPVVFSTGYWSLYALPVLAFIGVIAWKRREDELSKDSVLL